MPTIYNVSDITNILSGTIQRNVLVRGEVEILTDGPPNAFYLINESKKLRCFVPQGVMAPTLEQGQVAVVDGKITLFSSFSQYQITVSNIQVNGVNTNTFSVTEITDQISRLVENTPVLQNIRIQGEVLEIFQNTSNWELCDIGGTSALHIKCVNPGSIGPDIEVGNNVCVQGEISIYPPRSLYQVNVTEVGPTTESNTLKCQCPGCQSCRPQGGNQSCPSLQDPEYELCANCYHESPDREDRVAQAVYAYLDALGGNGFTPVKERTIQNFSRPGRADVVLIKGEDGAETFAAIAECKGAGYEGNGRAQLKGYLSVTNTRFGIFANRVDPSKWEFYKEQGQNQYELITCDQFKEEVKGLTDRALIIARNQIDTLETENNELKQIQRGLKEEFDKIKVFLKSAMQEVNQISQKIDG
ncbi:MAG: exodeoxyribonuclease VII large subunit [Candidatus Poribacteria bacterium]|nr:exodeoxyribonuclease VII large subunit [Candidatus Poribacteria bacterium]